MKKTGMLLLLVGCLAACDNAKDLPLMGRYVAKNVCASIWQEGYDQEAAVRYVTNVAPFIQPSWKVLVDADQVQVNSFWFPWLSPKTAFFLSSEHATDCRNDYPVEPLPGVDPIAPATPSATFVDQINPDSALQRYLDSVIAVGAPEHTTAILVLHANQVIAEAYRDGLGPDSPLKGFSMSKSFANLLVGRKVMRESIGVDDGLMLPGWALDQRAAISWDNSLRMSSGLLWHEASLGENNDQGQMFYNTSDPSAYAWSKPYNTDPNTGFNYSSGDYMNIASALVSGGADWFDPGWNLDQDFVLEFTPDGETPLLGEGVYLTTRGWAALASLYMNAGELNGSPVLSQDWVDYSLTPSDTNYDYGAGIWLNLGQNLFPSLSPDIFAFAGSYDRYVVAVPSRDVVVVRIGFSAQPGDFDMERFVGNVLELVPY